MFESQPWVNVPLHSAVEVFGAFAGIMTGMIILLRKGGLSASQSIYVSCGLLSMGIVDVFHGSVEPGNLFVWLHSTAVLFGGFFFSLAWLPEGERNRKAGIYPPIVAVASVIFGLLSILFPEQLPLMISKGKMTATAIAINIVAGIFFISSSPRFFISYKSNRNKGDLLFFLASLFFGIAGFFFYFDPPWHPRWWYWHFIRLTAFIILFGYVVSIFRIVTTAIANSVGILSTTSTEISATVTQHERTASQQASMVNETTVTIDELGASSRQSSDQATSAATLAQKASTMTEEGDKTIRQAIDAMQSLKDKIGAVAEQILRLSEQTSQIGNIASLVGDIAGQTRMLALNAAVEAARAGEHGKGFAVVASEVRKLADQSKKSAEQANVLIVEIQKATNSTIMKTEEGTKTVEGITKLARNVSELFNNLSTAAGSVYENAQQVLLNTKQQTAAISQVIEAMNTINTGAKETAAGISQTKIGIEKLNDTAKSLKEMV